MRASIPDPRATSRPLPPCPHSAGQHGGTEPTLVETLWPPVSAPCQQALTSVHFCFFSRNCEDKSCPHHALQGERRGQCHAGWEMWLTARGCRCCVPGTHTVPQNRPSSLTLGPQMRRQSRKTSMAKHTKASCPMPLVYFYFEHFQNIIQS